MKKKIRSVFLFVFCMLILNGCVTKSQKPGVEYPLQSSNLMKAWVGEWTENKRLDAISEYPKQYEAVVMDGDDGTYVTFKTEYQALEAQVVCVSKVNDQEEEFELNQYTDMYIKTECHNNIITVHTEWWYMGGDGTNRYPDWSYLVRVEDAEGSEHYYYFRVNYSK